MGLSHQLLPVLSIALLCVLGAMGETEAETHLECIDFVEDLTSNGWRAFRADQLRNAAGSADLPEEFRGRLQAPGIFWMEGDGMNGGFAKSSRSFPAIAPSFVYIKYYAVQKYEESHVSIQPAANPEPNFYYPAMQLLPRSTEGSFEWNEVVAQYDFTVNSGLLGASIGMLKYTKEEYLFVDKIVVAQGYELGNRTQPEAVELLKGLCGFGESSGSVCTAEDADAQAFVPDPTRCNFFHRCEWNGQEIKDSEFECPSTTVWCQAQSRCQTPDVCPCTINKQ